VLHSVTCLKTCHFAAYLTSLWTSIYVFYVNTARDVVTVLLIFAKYLSLYLHIFTCTYRGTHTQAHMYNQHTTWMATTKHNSLVERGGRKTLLETLHTPKKKCQEKPIFANLKKRFEHIELPAKLLGYFLRSNKSNINQSLVFFAASWFDNRTCLYKHVTFLSFGSFFDTDHSEMGIPQDYQKKGTKERHRACNCPRRVWGSQWTMGRLLYKERLGDLKIN